MTRNCSASLLSHMGQKTGTAIPQEYKTNALYQQLPARRIAFIALSSREATCKLCGNCIP